ncbi:MAG: ribonuclease Z [Prevotellaceae bacterium]|jgi:ribonuclease Z|nr:ribonuclease Z [Prevotellaceae bacterium]
MSFEVTILGSRSALPIKNHFPTAQVLHIQEQLFLIDCGEGAQMQLLRAGLSLLRIQAVFISHLHGDHLFGLFGLLSTMSMLGRKSELPIYAPPPMKNVLRDHLYYFGDGMMYQPVVHHIPTDSPALIYEDKAMTVHTVPLRHRVPTSGFLFREKTPPRNVHKYLIAQYRLSVNEIVQLKNGADITRPDGESLKNETMTYLPYTPCAYAYCSDTQFSEDVIEQVRGVDLLYHEATFQSDRAELARQTMHATAADAATVAKQAAVKKLLIGHFSSRYPSSDGFLHEAQAIFPNTEIGQELETYRISPP